MPVEQVINSRERIPGKIWTGQVESAALDQLKNIANLPDAAQRRVLGGHRG